MTKSIVARYAGGRIYAEKVQQDAVERYGIAEGREIPLPMLLHLVYTGKAEVFDEKGARLSFEDVVKLVGNSEAFSVFIVLHDLAKKGKTVAVDGAREIRIQGENVKVYVLDEDSYISAEDLYKLVDRAVRQGYKLVIAVVDINGEITYYEVNKMDFPRIERRWDL